MLEYNETRKEYDITTDLRFNNFAKDNNVFSNKLSLSDFVEGVVKNNLKENINEINVGDIKKNVQKFLENEGIILKNNKIKLAYGRIMHSIRPQKKAAQKANIDQLKRIDKIINENNVYFDTVKNNLIYVTELPKEEILDGRNWIKIPINIYKNENKVVTLGRVSSETITKNKRYKKID